MLVKSVGLVTVVMMQRNLWSLTERHLCLPLITEEEKMLIIFLWEDATEADSASSGTGNWEIMELQMGNKKHLKNVGPTRHCEPFYIAIHQVSLLSRAACASMSTTITTTTTITRDRGDRYGPMEWAQKTAAGNIIVLTVTYRLQCSKHEIIIMY